MKYYSPAFEDLFVIDDLGMRTERELGATRLSINGKGLFDQHSNVAPSMTEPVRRVRWRGMLREPLLHFLIVGAVLVAAAKFYGTLSSDAKDRRIVIGPEKVERIAANYARQYGAAPAPEQLRALIDQYVTEEISFREGMAQGLNQDDEIIRRRIVQKFQFLQQDLSVVPDPTPARLQAFYDQRADQYQIPAAVAFTHIYFSPDRAGDDAAKSRAIQALALLDPGNALQAQGQGDPFMGQEEYGPLAPTEVRRVFGESEFSQKIFESPPHRWSGPYRSGYGWHLVYLHEKHPARRPKLEEMREQVQADYLAHERETQNRQAFAKLAQKYAIIRPQG